VVTGWERTGWGEDKGRVWMESDRKSCWEGEQWIVPQEKEGK
jgi:hypothetical protein